MSLPVRTRLTKQQRGHENTMENDADSLGHFPWHGVIAARGGSKTVDATQAHAWCAVLDWPCGVALCPGRQLTAIQSPGRERRGAGAAADPRGRQPAEHLGDVRPSLRRTRRGPRDPLALCP